MSNIDWEALRAAAESARQYAHAPYSNFSVGAAVLTTDGTIFGGSNVENASYGAAICAERSAIVAAVTAGKKNLRALTIVTGANSPTPPCGICRQFISEFAQDLPIKSVTSDGAIADYNLKDLLPHAFDADQLE